MLSSRQVIDVAGNYQLDEDDNPIIYTSENYK
jgi:hypothetical protein